MSFDQYHIDILTAHFVQHPDWFDVVVASNLFGDILSDLGPAVAGGIGIAPSANLNPERRFPSMFEPVHGSAPDIAGKGVANPIATLWSVVMMLEFLGEKEAGGPFDDGHRNGHRRKQVPDAGPRRYGPDRRVYFGSFGGFGGQWLNTGFVYMTQICYPISDGFLS